MRFVLWFDEVDKNSISKVGGKGANLGELTRAGIPTPPGFIVTAEAYFHFLRTSGIREKIVFLVGKAHPDSSSQLSREIKTLILSSRVPPEIAGEIMEAYEKIGEGLVAVRSSATAEDLPSASFAGQQSTFLNVRGKEDVVQNVLACWASLFEERAIFYRTQHGFDHLKVGIAVPVQRMVQSEVSGVMFTLDPLNSDRSKIVIEAAYGLGEVVVSGAVNPDLYTVDKETLTILERKVFSQDWKLVLSPEGRGNLREDIPPQLRNAQKLEDKYILSLASLGVKIEEHYHFPQDIEWAKEGEKLYIVQSRPVTTIREEEKEEEIQGKVILSGIGASPGRAWGKVCLVPASEDIHKVKEGDILVAEMTTPDFVPAMKRAVAIVTDRGGRTCHAAIVSRELGVPCVVGTGKATQVLKPGDVITVDGTSGKVYEGKIEGKKEERAISTPKIETRTKVYVNLADPDYADKVAARYVDGVGLLRAEFIIASLGYHPNYLLAQGRGEEFISKLSGGLSTFCQAFRPRPVVYRTTDFKTNEYRGLKGGEDYEDIEENPMLGYRGCSRYVRDVDAFRLETEAIKRVRKQFRNLWVMIPFVRTPGELRKIVELLEAEGIRRADDFKLWMMVEVPSNVILLDEFIDCGLDGLSIGSNDLTQLILGIDRDNPKLAAEFDEKNEAVMWAVEKTITTARRRNVTCSVCGQAPSFYPEFTEKIVEWGITSVSVNPDMIEKTREVVASAEAKILCI
jgi:pyruvate,water dikinase